MIKIITIDKIKENAIKNLIDLYLKRLENRQKIEIIEIHPEKYHLSDSFEKAKDIEGDRIIKKITNFSISTIISLDEKGHPFTSLDFSKMIAQTLNQKHLTFIIGGAYGLSENVLKRSDFILSLSKMTFTHELARLFLIEQIYRAYTLNNNIKYHN
ncbi:MAG: 23S rRNA (pseudouridine(1915)-N(3))-methyltransferase RlmH [Candidatus Cloacimonetes bacterium]|nr:23S rRNA (pseudouridine(1915)-N(3))-methyltransferase RlmH [Candidatus Cloacimonadota bacterium]